MGVALVQSGSVRVAGTTSPAMSLARLWHDQGKGQQAPELLAPVYGWFTEGLDTAIFEGSEGAAGGVSGGHLRFNRPIARVIGPRGAADAPVTAQAMSSQGALVVCAVGRRSSVPTSSF